MNEKRNEKEIRPKISVIVPVYNVMPYLRDSLDSILNQTLSDLEIILIDDGSNDGSTEICSLFAERDRRIKLIKTDHQGVSYAKNTALSVACGDYIAFVDSDDWIELDMFSYLFQLAESVHADIATCVIVKEYPNGKSVIEGNSKCYKADWIKVIDEINYGGEFNAYLVNKLFRKSLLDGITFQNSASIGEDYCFLMKVLLREPAVIRGGECKYHYRQRADSVSYTGFCNVQKSWCNRQNYYNTFQTLERYSCELADGALAYYILQEMAVPISMVKAHHYSKMMNKSVQREIRKYLMRYLSLRRVPFYLKCCAILLCVHEKLLLIPYQIIFSRARSVGST